MKAWFVTILGAVVCVGMILAGCKKDNSQKDRLKSTRLFTMDSVAGEIVELNAKSGAELNRFLAPGLGISGLDCGLAYDSVTGILFFHDSIVDPTVIWKIDPDDPDPTGTATTIPSLDTDYVGLSHDGTFLMALRPDVPNEGIVWVNPDTGTYIKTVVYPSTVDLEDALAGEGSVLFAAGYDPSVPENVIYQLDLLGNAGCPLTTGIPGFDPRGLGYANGFLFIADMGNSQILVADMEAGGNIINAFPIQGATSTCGLAAGSK
ncbi:MAG: hypothetical protein O6952_07010 [Planctomycetota bacterium]|nr:hypothetical protein [Planctomycetota bacterium]